MLANKIYGITASRVTFWQTRLFRLTGRLRYGQVIGYMAQRLASVSRICGLLFVLIAASLMSAEAGPTEIFPFVRYNPEASAPLALAISGEGRVSPFVNGQVLPLGWWLTMTATADRGYVFVGWQKVNIFTELQYVVGPSGQLLPPVVSTVVSPVPGWVRQPMLRFQVEPWNTLVEIPGVETITESTGWQADFVPVKDVFH